MPVLLMVIAGYFVIDRLFTVMNTGKTITITPGIVVLCLLDGAFFAVVLVIASLNWSSS